MTPDTFGSFAYRKLCESRAALPAGVKLTPEASIRLLDLCLETWAKAHRVKRKIMLTDDQWLAEISADPANAGLHVFQEHRKYLLWCKSNAKQPTRRRFTNWLIRADRLLEGPKELRKPVQEGPEEPTGWKGWVDANLPDWSPYRSTGEQGQKPWSGLPLDARQAIYRGMQA